MSTTPHDAAEEAEEALSRSPEAPEAPPAPEGAAGAPDARHEALEEPDGTSDEPGDPLPHDGSVPGALGADVAGRPPAHRRLPAGH